MLTSVCWELTNRCTLRCRHCVTSAGEARDGELTAAEIIECASRLYSAGVRHVYVTGGEPFARQDAARILDQLGKLKFSLDLATNGYLLGRAALRVLKRHRVRLTISLDGGEAATHDSLRGDGAFARAVLAVECAVAAGLHVTAAMAVTKGNFSEMRRVAQLAKSLGCRRIHYSEVVKAGRASEAWADLGLTSTQRQRLRRAADTAATDAFGGGFSAMDERCWVDGSGLFVTADGRVFRCSELSQQSGGTSIGDIRDASLLARVRATTAALSYCCHRVYAGPHATLVMSSNRACPLLKRRELAGYHICSLEQLKVECGKLWGKMLEVCTECHDPDCLGYIWMLPDEENEFLDAGGSVVQLNGRTGPLFVDVYPRDGNGRLKVSTVKPPCPYRRANGLCSLYGARPLACHLYPLGPETLADGTVVLGLHRECEYVRRLGTHGQDELVQRVKELVSRLSSSLRRELRNNARAVESVSVKPDGENDFIAVAEI